MRIPNKVLIIQTASIGDVVLATPLVESFSAAGWQVDLMIRKEAKTLFVNHPQVNQLLVWEKKTKKYRNLFRIIRKIREQKYDAVINLQRFLSTGLVAVFSNSPIRLGFKKNPMSFLFTKSFAHLIGNKNPMIHEIDRNLSLIDGLIPAIRKVRLYPSQNDYEMVADYKSKPYICIAPASLWETKKFPVEKWLEFIQSIPESMMVYLIGSVADIQLCNNMILLSNRNQIESLAGNLNLLQTAALMKDAKMNFTNDSAPQHLASGVNAPVAVIFCSTVPEFGFGPLSETSFILQSDKILPCRPCGLHGKNICPEKHFNCAHTIDNPKLLACLTY